MIENLLIFGDSYSTHRAYIPKEFPTYYCDGGQGPDEPVTDMRWEQTWWGRLLKNTDAKLIQNNSWTGSAIGYTGYLGDCSKTSSFICRYHKLLESGFFDTNSIDTSSSLAVPTIAGAMRLLGKCSLRIGSGKTFSVCGLPFATLWRS